MRLKIKKKDLVIDVQDIPHAMAWTLLLAAVGFVALWRLGWL